MGFGPAKQAVGGSGAGGDAGAANSFRVVIKTDIAKVSAKEFGDAAKNPTVHQQRTFDKRVSTVIKKSTTNSKGILFSDLPGGLMKDKENFVGKNKRLLFVGAEGIRIGDARLSRTGFSLSEKTLVNTQGLAVAAAAGQVLGTGLDAAVSARDILRKGGSLGEVGLAFLKAGPGKVANQISDLFGVKKALTALTTLISGDEKNSIEDAIKRSLEVALDYEKFLTDKENKAAKRELTEASNYLREKQERLAKNIKAYPQRPVDRLDFLRETIKDEGARERLFVRDFGGRPLWKTLGVSINEGR